MKGFDRSKSYSELRNQYENRSEVVDQERKTFARRNVIN